MKNKKILISFLIILPLGLWFLSLYTDVLKPKPTVTKIDTVAGAPLQYSQERTAFIEDLKQQNLQLSRQDQQVVTALKEQKNPILLTENVVLQYDQSQDTFQAEITTIRIEPAKREAVSWLRNQGLSDEAICILPVTFTIDEKSAKSLRGLDIVFDPLPAECK